MNHLSMKFVLAITVAGLALLAESSSAYAQRATLDVEVFASGGSNDPDNAISSANIEYDGQIDTLRGYLGNDMGLKGAVVRAAPITYTVFQPYNDGFQVAGGYGDVEIQFRGEQPTAAQILLIQNYIASTLNPSSSYYDEFPRP